jgi:hypothetical protein
LGYFLMVRTSSFPSNAALGLGLADLAGGLTGNENS